MKQPLQRTEKPCVMCVQYLISYANYAINLSQAEILTSHKSYSTTFDPCSMDLKSFIPLEKAYNMTSLRRVFGKKEKKSNKPIFNCHAIAKRVKVVTTRTIIILMIIRVMYTLI